MKRQIFFLTILCLALSTWAQDDAQRLKLFARNIFAYNQLYTQEKVYLHVDNNGYLPGETIWFKAYVFNAASLLPTDMSKVLYVELLNPSGQLIERKTLPIINGRTYGEIKLDELLCHPGYYELRAYTRAMLNWDEAYIFQRILPVFEAPEDFVNFTNLEMPEPTFMRKGHGLVRSQPKPLTEETTQKKGKLLLTFYPEGGHITKGNPSTVAYRLTDKDGLPLHGMISVYDNNNQLVLTSQTLHDGMGRFQLPADWQGGSVYASNEINSQNAFRLPKPREEGCDLNIERADDGSVIVNVRPSNSFKDETLGLTVTCRGRLLFFKDFKPSQQDTIHIIRPRLSDGICQITLFTSQGEILSERMVWAKPERSKPVMTIRQNEQSYTPFQPVVLDIDLKDGEGNPLRGDFSLSVRDAFTETGPDTHPLEVEMLLASDLKGYIHAPEYYFEKDDSLHRQAIDLLLMVQGWRRYQWREMAGLDTFQLKQPAEDGLLLYGSLNLTNAVKNNLGKFNELSLNFIVNTNEGTKTFWVDTDSTGHFALQLPPFNEDAPAIISVTNKKDRRVYTDLKINRHFSPSLKPYEPWAMATPIDIEQSRQNALSNEHETFHWEDTIPDLVSKIIKLKPVKIGAKQPGFYPRSIYGWSGESGAKHFSTYYYNLSEELDKYLDQGNAIPTVTDWLATVNPNVDIIQEDNTRGILYRGKKVCIISDNDRTELGRLPVNTHTGLMHEYRTLIIIENQYDASKVNQMTNGDLSIDGVSQEYGAIIYLYTNPKAHTYYKRGTRWITLHGYSTCTDFYSPDYRLSEMPTETDHRRTLYWNPSLTTDEKGHADVIFYSSSRPTQQLHINAQGIAINGEMFNAK